MARWVLADSAHIPVRVPGRRCSRRRAGGRRESQMANSRRPGPPIWLKTRARRDISPTWTTGVTYREGPFVGYRYYDAVAVEPGNRSAMASHTPSSRMRGLGCRRERALRFHSRCGISAPVLVPRLCRCTSRPPRVSFRRHAQCNGSPGLPRLSWSPERSARWCFVSMRPHSGNGTRASTAGASIRVVARFAWRHRVAIFAWRRPLPSEMDNPHSIRSKRDLAAASPRGNPCPARASALTPQVPEMYRHPTPGCFALPESARAFAELSSPSTAPRASARHAVHHRFDGERHGCLLAGAPSVSHHRLGHGRVGEQDEPRSEGDDAGDGCRHAAAVPYHKSGVPLESVKGFVSMLNGHYLTGFIYAVRNLFRK